MQKIIKRYLPAALATVVVATLAAPAQATVTAISSGGSDGTRYPIVDGDAANDSITVTCGPDANVKINGLDPVAASGTPGPVPIPCATMTGIDVDGGAGVDFIDLREMTRAAGFTDPRLCAPCPNRGFSVIVECDESDGDDTIMSSPIGGGIGGCAGGSGMAGNDFVTGGDGREEVDLGAGDDRILGAGGNDYVLGGSGDDYMRGEAGKDKLFGEGGADRMYGGSGRDRCDGGPGEDTAWSCEILRGIERSSRALWRSA